MLNIEDDKVTLSIIPTDEDGIDLEDEALHIDLNEFNTKEQIVDAILKVAKANNVDDEGFFEMVPAIAEEAYKAIKAHRPTLQ